MSRPLKCALQQKKYLESMCSVRRDHLEDLDVDGKGF